MITSQAQAQHKELEVGSSLIKLGSWQLNSSHYRVASVGNVENVTDVVIIESLPPK